MGSTLFVSRGDSKLSCNPGTGLFDALFFEFLLHLLVDLLLASLVAARARKHSPLSSPTQMPLCFEMLKCSHLGCVLRIAFLLWNARGVDCGDAAVVAGWVLLKEVVSSGFVAHLSFLLS